MHFAIFDGVIFSENNCIGFIKRRVSDLRKIDLESQSDILAKKEMELKMEELSKRIQYSFFFPDYKPSEVEIHKNEKAVFIDECIPSFNPDENRLPLYDFSPENLQQLIELVENGPHTEQGITSLKLAWALINKYIISISTVAKNP